MSAPTGQPRRKKPRSRRRFWFRLHGFFSLPVWLLFCFVCLTGTLAVVSHELAWLANPAIRATNPDARPALPVAELAAAVQRKVPTADIGYVVLPEPYLAAHVAFSAAGMPAAIAYVNPYTADVQAIETGITFISFMRSLHGWLLAPWQHGYSAGYYLVSSMAVLLTGALLTGLVVYRKFWRAWLRPTLRWRADARTWLGDLHRLSGAWSIWFMAVIGLTGLWYLAQAVMWHNGIEYEPESLPMAVQELPLPATGLPPERLPLATLLAAAGRALPDMQPAWISLPEHNRDYVTVYGSGDTVLYDAYAWRVQVNPWTGAVAGVRTPADMEVLESLAHIADPLHYGTLGGLWTKLLWFLFGVLLTGMSLTGFMIWSRRTVGEPGRVAPRRRRRVAGPEGAS
ncbi:MAG: PepSY-associated TM helix domain-containing protein [Pseudomonadota bacterium]